MTGLSDLSDIIARVGAVRAYQPTSNEGGCNMSFTLSFHMEYENVVASYLNLLKIF